ncbi:aryl-sulfate sulfotransferase [Formosa sp. L2A11]|uniref:aryl-sulfate sulfotransferase n=1 Tax=Formosa sp. L2A11 TaxID=2686363 RepID=UPI00131D6260|nr:aryl-sulfate sulfotransferase [Formosa sp. L2A11]
MKFKYLNIPLLLVFLFLVSACESEETTSNETNTDLETISSITDGFVLYSYIGDNTTHLIDSLGADVKTWTSSYSSSGSSYLSENNTLLRLGKLPKVNTGSFSTGGLVAGIIEELDGNSNVVWSIEKASDEGTFHHDFKEIDDNTIIALSWQLRTYNDSEYWNELIVMIDKTDNSVIWEWNAMDNGGLFPEDDDKEDYLHVNSVDYKDRNILISSRSNNTLYIINEDDKKITTILTANGALSGQHDATFLDNGNILVFNNETDTNTSEVLELTQSDNVVWSYSNNFYSDHISGAQRLESGNTLICSGTEGRFIEVTESRDEVWDYMPENTTSNKASEIFKARKYVTY